MLFVLPQINTLFSSLNVQHANQTNVLLSLVDTFLIAEIIFAFYIRKGIQQRSATYNNFILAAICLLVLNGASGYFYGIFMTNSIITPIYNLESSLGDRSSTESSLQPTSSPTPTPNVVKSSLDTTNWKTFTYADHSFSLKYPPIWFTEYSPVFSDNNPPSFAGYFSFFNVGKPAEYSAGDTSGNEILRIYLQSGIKLSESEEIAEFKQDDKSRGNGTIEETTVDNRPAVKYQEADYVQYDIVVSTDKNMTIVGWSKEALNNIDGVIHTLKFNLTSYQPI